MACLVVVALSTVNSSHVAAVAAVPSLILEESFQLTAVIGKVAIAQNPGQRPPSTESLVTRSRGQKVWSVTHMGQPQSVERGVSWHLSVSV